MYRDIGPKSDARMEVRLPKKLKRDIERYAKKKNMSLTSLVIRLFTSLLAADKKLEIPPDADQI